MTTSSARLAALLALALLPLSASAGEEQIKTDSAREAYHRNYKIFLDHRAFAQSPNGSWGIAGYQSSREAASKMALDLCNKGLPAGAPPCVIININGEWKR